MLARLKKPGPVSTFVSPFAGCRVRSMCESVEVFWEEPFKMMCTINVTVGRLHFRGIDPLLELTERSQRGRRERTRAGSRNDVMRGANVGILLALKVTLCLLTFACCLSCLPKSLRQLTIITFFFSFFSSIVSLLSSELQLRIQIN